MVDVLPMTAADPATLSSWRPELLLIATFLATMPLSLVARGRLPGLTRFVAIVGLVAAASAAIIGLGNGPTGVLGPVLVVDPLAALVRALLVVAALAAVVLGSRQWRGRPAVHDLGVAVIPFLMLHTLAACVVVEARGIVGIVVGVMGLGVMGTLVAGLAARTPQARAAALRFGVGIAAGAAVVTYGVSLLYPMVGTDDLAAMGTALLAGLPTRGAMIVIVVLLVLGLTGLAVTTPLTWRRAGARSADDLPPMIIGYLSTVPPLAILVLLWRLARALAGSIGDPSAAALQRLLPWPGLLTGLAVAAMTLGAVLALRQQRVTVLLAWLAVAQAGYGLLALIAAPEVLLAPTLLHLGFFALANLGAFGLAQVVVAARGDDARAAFVGWGRRQFLPAAMLAVFLMSLAGMPPTVGFVARVRLLAALVETDRLGLAVTVAGLGLLAAFGYLRVVIDMFRPVRPESEVTTVDLGPLAMLSLLALLAPVLAGGLVWHLLTAVAIRAATGL